MQLAQLWQPNKDKSNQIRFRAMMESGQLVDEVADIVQTQVIAPKARASIRNRDAVPLYHHTEEGRPPVWKENLLVENRNVAVARHGQPIRARGQPELVEGDQDRRG